MEPVALIDHARQAGLVVRREGDRLIVRGPKRLGDLAAHLLDRKAEVMAALDAEADPGVAMALDVFPGARVVTANQPAVWPPAGGWIPSSARTIDPYATAAPTTACPCCGATAWYRAGTGFTCGVCHPLPNTGYTAVTDAELDATLFGLAERAGFPRLPLSPGISVLAGRNAWSRFAASTTSPSLRASAVAALHGREPGEDDVEDDRVAIREHLVELKALVQDETDRVETAESAVCAASTPVHAMETDDVVGGETDPGVAMALDVFPAETGSSASEQPDLAVLRAELAVRAAAREAAIAWREAAMRAQLESVRPGEPLSFLKARPEIHVTSAPERCRSAGHVHLPPGRACPSCGEPSRVRGGRCDPCFAAALGVVPTDVLVKGKGQR